MYLAGQAERDSLEPLRPFDRAQGRLELAEGRGASKESWHAQQHGYAMAALLISISMMTIMMTVAMPVWKTATQREREAELIFRGQQYVRAIELYQRKLPGAAPPNLDVLIDQKFLRKKYKDPITGDDFELLTPNSPATAGPPQQPGGQRAGGPPASRGANPAQFSLQGGRGAGQGATFGVQAGISGVVSKSKASSLRLYNGRSHYNEWQFVYVPRTPAPGAGGAPGAATPGQRGRGPGGLDPVIGPGGRGFPPGRGDGRGFGPGRGDGRGFGPGRGDGRGFQPNQPGQLPGGRGPGGQPFMPGIQPFPQQPQPQRPPGN